jgi:hypothetical protein
MFRTSLFSKLSALPRRKLLTGAGALAVVAAILFLLLSSKSGAVGGKVQALLGKEGIPLEQFPTQIAGVYCQTLKECNPGAELQARTGYGDFEAKCKVEWENRFREDVMAGMNEAIARGSFNYNPIAASDCLQKVVALGCKAFDADVYEVCADAFQGDTSDGSCRSGYECKAGQRCETENQCPGVCVSKSGASQPCRNSGDCASGLFCSERSGSCTPLVEVNGACDPSAGEFQCVEGSVCKDRKCVAYANIYVGSQNDSCDLLSRCRPGLVCAMGDDANKCEPMAAVGGACKVAYPSQCPEGSFCNANPTFGKTTGTCEAARKDGSDCGGNLECASPLRCVEGKCRNVAKRGEQCKANADCWSSNCSKGTCSEADPCDRARTERAG